MATNLLGVLRALSVSSKSRRCVPNRRTFESSDTFPRGSGQRIRTPNRCFGRSTLLVCSDPVLTLLALLELKIRVEGIQVRVTARQKSAARQPHKNQLQSPAENRHKLFANKNSSGSRPKITKHVSGQLVFERSCLVVDFIHQRGKGAEQFVKLLFGHWC